MSYYLRGPVVPGQEFFLEVRVGRVPYYGVLASIEDTEYVVFVRRIPTDLSFIVVFRADILPGGIVMTGKVKDKYFNVGAAPYGKERALAVRDERSLFLPVNKEVRNFAVFLAGVPYFLLLPNKEVVSFITDSEVSGFEKRYSFTEIYAVPTTVYYSGRPFGLPEIIQTEESFAIGEKIPDIYTNAADSLQNIPYYYCKESLCAKNCKGGCALSDETCLFSSEEEGFVCMTPEEVKPPYYKQPWFIAAATSLGFVLFLSIIMLVAVLLVR